MGQSSWLERLPARTRDVMASLGEVKTFSSGEGLVNRGAVESHLFLVEAGTVEVARNGLPAIQLGPGDLVGEMAFLDNAPRRNTITAATEVRARRILRTELMAAFVTDPAELRTVLEEVARLKEERLSTVPSGEQAAAAFVKQLSSESLSHRAVRHPYLQALADGTLPDLRWALADFARNYYGYSAHFPRYLTTVISRLENPAHRKSLLENLTEESGVYGEEEYAELATFGVKREWIEGIAHPLLFQRFSRALGVDHAGHRETDQVACWREMFLSVLSEGGPAEALGALGIGTENIVRTIYGPFVKALSRLDLRPEDTVFFPLHTAVDDHHQATLEAISADFARTEEGRVGLRRGMLKALSLRTAFWDWLHERAKDPSRAEAVA
ncbi:MAG: iron-containing redox enzyme family protein [Deltaproteobacteria bacterium]|nr:iron-containing redox enzyme family protein [Deltaproteobacteria bacterium]